MATKIIELREYVYFKSIKKFVSKLHLFTVGMLIVSAISLYGFYSFIDSKKEQLSAIVQPILPKSFEERLVDYIMSNSNMEYTTAHKLAHSILLNSEAHNIPVNLVLGVIKVESNFKQYAISNAGALGFMQVMPRWHYDKIAKMEDKNIYSPHTNTALGTKILHDCLKKHKSVKMALQCYNGNQSDETMTYANKVLKAVPVSI